jgi:CRISPR-associated protein Cas4
METALYQKKPQIAGKAAHASIENQTYSTRKDILQGAEIWCDRYRLHGKIDVFDIASGKLTERKREIKTIYDGYIFQVYAHYFGLTEMGYNVNSIVLYDMLHNKSHPVALPHANHEMLQKFEQLIERINQYDMNDPGFIANASKCQNCIYNNICDTSLC